MWTTVVGYEAQEMNQYYINDYMIDPRLKTRRQFSRLTGISKGIFAYSGRSDEFMSLPKALILCL